MANSANKMLLSDGIIPYWGSVAAVNSTTVTVDGNSTDVNTWYPTFVIGGTGTSRVLTVSQNGLQFKPSTGTLTATVFMCCL